MNKEWDKIIKRKAAWLALKGCVSLSKALPLSWNYFIGNALGSLVYLIIGSTS